MEWEKWDVEQTCDWLTEVGIKAETIKRFREEDINGKALEALTESQLRMMSLKMGEITLIMKQRNGLLQSMCTEGDMDKTPEDQCTHERIDQKPCFFRKPLDPMQLYEKGKFLPKPEAGGSLLDVRHHYVSLARFNVSSLESIAMEFASACLNSRTNATIHFGVRGGSPGEAGKIIGHPISRQIQQLDVSSSVELYFYRDQWSIAKECISSYRVVKLRNDSANEAQLVVVEMDVEPKSVVVTADEDVFFIRQPRGEETKLLLFEAGKITSVAKKEIPKAVQSIKQHSQRRKHEEEAACQTTPIVCENLARRMKKLLCGGDDTMAENVYPIVVTNKLQKTNEDRITDFQFMKHLQWKALFDFDDAENRTSSLYHYLEKQENQVLQVLSIEDFMQDSSQAERALKTPRYRPWIFTNGCAFGDAESRQKMDVRTWKPQRGQGFKEAVRFLKLDTPSNRTIVIFLLLSGDFDVMFETMEELCMIYPDQWIMFAEDEEMAKPWMLKMLERNLVKDERNMKMRSICGMPWKHVSHTFMQMLDLDQEAECELPTSQGACIPLPAKVKNRFVDLEVLGSNECQSLNIYSNSKKAEQQRLHTEQRFYKGEEVDWLNFALDQVMERSMFQSLKREVADTLSGQGHMPSDERVGMIRIYHQPGAGGTTIARHILWEMKDTYRCAVVKTITDQTLQHIKDLHMYEDTKSPKPVLLLLDDMDEDRIGPFKADLEEQARRGARLEIKSPPKVFYVLLVCTRCVHVPVKMPNGYFLKHELKEREMKWMKDKHAQLEERHKQKKSVDPKHLIGFNIMKLNFDRNKSARYIGQFIEEITDRKERKLLKYLALLRAYNLHFQPLPVSCFDTMMKDDEKPQKWERILSEACKVLLNERRKGGIEQLKIIHTFLAEEILGKLLFTEDGQQQLLCDVMVELMDIPGLLDLTESGQKLATSIADTVKCRVKRPDGTPETLFSPFIEKMLKDSKQGIDKAVEVVERVFDVTEDVFVAQQLTRILISVGRWADAVYWAKTMTNKRNDNSYLWDTFGRIYLRQMGHLSSESRKGRRSAKDAVEFLKLAVSAKEKFQKSQQVHCDSLFDVDNNAGYLGEMDTTVQFLEYLKNVDGLQDETLFHSFVVKGSDAPPALKNYWGGTHMQDFRELIDGAAKAMEYLADQHHQIRDESGDTLQREKAKKSRQDYIRLRARLHTFLGENDDTTPHGLTEDEAKLYRRRRIFGLVGNTYADIFELPKTQEGEQTLERIKHLVENNQSRYDTHEEDLRIQLTVNFTLCSRKYRNDDIKRSISHKEMAKLSCDLYRKTDANSTRYLEVFMFAVVFNWKRPCMSFLPEILGMEFPAILKQWKEAFYRKYPWRRNNKYQKETTICFFGKGTGMDMLAFPGEFGDSEEDVQPQNHRFWDSSSTHQRLEPFQGTLRDYGCQVLTWINYAGNKCDVQFPTSFPIKDQSFWNKEVTFFIGFTWAGPKAYNTRQLVS